LLRACSPEGTGFLADFRAARDGVQFSRAPERCWEMGGTVLQVVLKPAIYADMMRAARQVAPRELRK